MLRKAKAWLATLFYGAQARQINAAIRICDEAKRSQAVAAKQLKEKEARLLALQDKLLELQTSLESDLKAAEKSFAVYETALTAVRAELKVAADVTIPALTAAHRLVLARYDAEVAVQVRKQVAASVQDN